MKIVSLIILVLSGNSAIGQQDSFYAPFSDSSLPKELSIRLTHNSKTDLERVTAIFRWITDNIAYNERALHSAPWNYLYTEPEDSGSLKNLDQRVAEEVLKRRTGTCDGYARLFKTLCYYAGIRSELVTGYAGKEGAVVRNNFGCNHTWNAVFIDSTWKLLDATWASGYVTWRGGMFVKEYDSRYFLAAPENFIQDHYPEDLQWTLLKTVPAIREFRHSPFRQRTFLKYHITGFKPANGLIIAKPGDTIRIEIKSENINSDRQISADMFLDTSRYSTSDSKVLVPSITKQNTVTEYNYIVSSPDIQWLYILYNDDLILRYRLNVLKPQAVVASIK
jgi:hypothetical protein